MSRTIADLTAGTVVYVDEALNGEVVHTPYVYLGLDESGNARLLRQIAALAKRMNATNVASYDGCEADLWLENETDGFLSRFDAATRAALVNTEIKYVDYNQNSGGTAQVLSIARRCFLLSYSEEGYGDDPAGNEGPSFLPALKSFYLSQHPEVTTVADNTARIGYQPNGTAVNVWVRSAYSATSFRNVFTSGYASIYAATSGNNWLRPALSVAPATSVSDEGADAIFLLPDGRKTYWGIEATVSLGQTAKMPTRCKLSVPHDDFTVLSLQVCNNYGDETPTWVTCADGGVATFGTSKTADNWELGVKIHAEAPAAGRTIGEPSMIVEFEEE